MYCSAMFLYQAKEGKQREQKNYHKYLLADCPYKVGKAIDILYSPKLDFAMAGTKKTYWQNEKKGLFAIIFLFLLGLGGLIQFTLIYKKAKQKR